MSTSCSCLPISASEPQVRQWPTWRADTAGPTPTKAASAPCVGLREAYKEVAPRSGGRAVKLPGEDAWWLVRKLPACPVTDETPLDVAYAG